MTRQQHIVVVGAGPVGVIASLACAQRGFKVTLCEAESVVDESPRAATTHSSTLEMIASVGLIDRFTSEGLVARYFHFWDQGKRERVAQFDHDVLKDETAYPYVVQTEQHKLAHMGIEALRAHPNASVRFDTRVLDITQSDADVRVSVQGPEGVETLAADYVVGADGARSTLRKALGIEFEGITWPEKFIVLTVLDDFEKMMGCCYRNYLADPDAWTNLFKISGDDGKGRWRAVFPSAADETDEMALSDEATHRRLQHVCPTGTPYDLVHRNIYRVHQRVASTFRKGRVFLAGDSAHVNNPIGGLGLNSGIHDAMELASMFEEVRNGADRIIFDRYNRRRRDLNIEFVQQQTVANKKRLEEKDPAKRAEALNQIRETSEDPVRAKQFLMRSSLIDSVRKAQAIA